jgi:hypothetical protein
MLRSAISAASGVFIFAALASGSLAQTITIKTTPESAQLYWSALAFSHDGRILREFGSSAPRTSDEGEFVHTTAYDVTTGAVIRTRTLRY